MDKVEAFGQVPQCSQDLRRKDYAAEAELDAELLRTGGTYCLLNPAVLQLPMPPGKPVGNRFEIEWAMPDYKGDLGDLIKRSV